MSLLKSKATKPPKPNPMIVDESLMQDFKLSPLLRASDLAEQPVRVRGSLNKKKTNRRARHDVSSSPP